MALRTSAEDAEEMAAGFATFRIPIPEHAAEVTSLVADLFAISSLLTRLEDLSRDTRYRRNFAIIQSDLSLVQASLKYTLADVRDLFGGLEGGRAPPEGYKSTWRFLNQYFWDEAKYSLATRLAKYKAFFGELSELARDNYKESQFLPGLRSGMRTLYAAQTAQGDRIAQTFERMTFDRNPSVSRTPSSNRNPSSAGSAEPGSPVNDRRRQQRRSFERTRPPHLSPTSPRSPSSGTFSDFSVFPDIPGSPMTSATTATSRSGGSDVIRGHWAKSVFGNSHTSTPLPSSTARSTCRGDPIPGIKESLKEKGYEELLQLRVSHDMGYRRSINTNRSLNNDSDMLVSFYIRERDHRARILCKVPSRSRRSSDYFSLPLNLLEIWRDGPCLRLFRPRNNKTKVDFWAQLRFSTMEDLVVFHSTFVALRSQDIGHPVSDFEDFELEDEEELYGGKIYDDGYGHALRIYEDVETGAVRIQSSVHQGELNRTPVWTAFINPNLREHRFASLDRETRTVTLRNIKPVIFMSMEDYTPPRNNRGHHVLEFRSSSDANGFMDTLGDLARSRR